VVLNLIVTMILNMTKVDLLSNECCFSDVRSADQACAAKINTATLTERYFIMPFISTVVRGSLSPQHGSSMLRSYVVSGDCVRDNGMDWRDSSNVLRREHNIKTVKAKLSHYRPTQAFVVPGGWGSKNFQTFGTGRW